MENESTTDRARMVAVIVGGGDLVNDYKSSHFLDIYILDTVRSAL